MAPTELIAALWRALQEEDAATSVASAARTSQARLLGELRLAGVPTTRAVHGLAALWKMTLSIRDRLRLAERLRKRARRGTSRPALPFASHGVVATSGLPLSERALPPGTEESDMGKLFKRTTITEEWVEPKMSDDDLLAAAEEADEESEDDDLDEDLDEESDEDADTDEEAPPKRVAKASRK